MNEKDDKKAEESGKSFTLLYVAIVCFAVACVLFALAFVIKGAGVYMLIASTISSLAAVSFTNGQKRRAENKLCKIIKILSYVVMFAGLAVVIIGTATVNSTN